MQKLIMFVSHNATRTGAPIMLLNLLRHLNNVDSWNIQVVLLGKGDLIADFSKEYQTQLIEQENLEDDKLEELCREMINGNSLGIPDLIYSNTIANGRFLKAIAPFRIPVISHVHELKPAFERYALRYANIILSSEHFICVSKHVQDYLVTEYGVSINKTTVIHNGVDFSYISSQISSRESEARLHLGVQNDCFIVGGIGWASHQKGFDLWLKMAFSLKTKMIDEKIIFIWIGNTDGVYAKECIRDIEKLGIKECVILMGELGNPYAYMNAMDIIALSSRHESFSLVCIEAAYLCKPIIYFENSGGPKEIIGDLGFSVPSVSPDEMAATIAVLMKEKSLLNGKCEDLKHFALSNYDIRNSVEGIKFVIHKILKQKNLGL